MAIQMRTTTTGGSIALMFATVLGEQPASPADEGEVAAEFQQKGLQASGEGGLEFGPRVLVPEVEELQHVGTLEIASAR